MRHRAVYFFSVAVCLPVLSILAGSVKGEEGGKPRRILYITAAAGFKHGSREHSIPVIQKIARESGKFEVVCSDTTDGINRDSLRDFDAVFFSNTTGDLKKFPLGAEDRNALIQFVLRGKAFVGAHAATDTYKDWAPYYEMIGASFDGHPWHEEVTIEVEDPAHPAASPLPSPWVIKDEIYQFRNYSRDPLHVILRMHASSIKGKGKRKDGDYPIAWCKYFGQGKVFYTSLGHRNDVWDNPFFQQHLLGGILWALGDPSARANLAVGHEPVASEWKRIFDGQSLAFGTDWETSDDPQVTRKSWTVQPGGILRGGSGHDGERASHLYYIGKKYRNFEYRADVCINRDGNSGMYFRASAGNLGDNGEWRNWPRGYEAQVNNGYDRDPKKTGTFYPRPSLSADDIRRVLGYEKAADDGNFWFNQHVIASGDHFIIKLNGKVVVEHRDEKYQEGYFAYQMHHRGSVVKFKNIEVRELP